MKSHTKISWLLSVRNRILIFTVLVTLVPSFGMGWIFYTMSYNAKALKVQQRLIDSAGKLERDLSLWLKERDHDLRVFASSLVIVDNLTKIQTARDQPDSKDKENQTVNSRKRIAHYLNLVKDKYPDYNRLVIFDSDGQQIAASESPGEESAVVLPTGWNIRNASSGAFIGQALVKKDETLPLVVIGIPVYSDKGGGRLGILAVEIRIQGLLPFLKTVSADGEAGPWMIDLVQKDGRPLLTTAFPEGQQETALLSSQKLQLFANPHQLKAFNNGKWIVGLAAPCKELPWGMVISESYDHVFADVLRSRDRIILTAILFTLIIGLSASLVAGQIILPLEALRRGVMQVADGNLDVSLDIRRNDEFGIVTGMFNEMAVQLKQNQQELEKLAVTDTLTRLANRKQIMASLKTHIEYYRRYSAEFSLLMIDIDHFKQVNDTHGHLMGDVVLVEIAEIFNKMLRTMDVAGRYGGEEFLIILGQTTVQSAMLTAERIRQAVEKHPFMYQDRELHITISTGVTGIAGGDDTDNILIGRADKALYEAKTGGRNRVVLSTDHPAVKPAPSDDVATPRGENSPAEKDPASKWFI
jgi:diguanylate cyclase (GGDEF)-like protein